MTKRLGGIVRLHKWQVDEKRRQITELEVMREELVEKRENLKNELRSEQENISKTNVVDITYASYSTANMGRQENLNASIDEIDVSIENMKDELADAFKELKKFEIVEQRAMERELFEQKQKEQERLDELSLNMFRHNQNANGQNG